MKIYRLVISTLIISISGLFLLSATFAQDKESDWTEIRTAHYLLQTNTTPAEGRKLIDFMENVYNTYSLIFNYTKPLARPFVIKLYKNQKEFMATGVPTGVAASYNSGSRELAGYFSLKEDTFPYFAHEGYHQFNHMFFGEEYSKLIFPVWFDEGMADAIANGEVRNGKFYSCLKDGLLGNGRLSPIQKAISSNRHFPLKEFIRLDRETFMKNSGLCYAQSWSLCHFLLTYPEKEDPKRIIPTGKYCSVVERLYAGLDAYAKLRMRKAVPDTMKFETLEQVYGYAFMDTKTKTPIDLDELEKEWKEYVLNFKVKDKEDKIEEVKTSALLQKAGELLAKGDWVGLQSVLESLKSDAKETDIFDYYEFDINHLLKLAGDRAKGKKDKYIVNLLENKALKEWEIRDVLDNPEAWRMEKGKLIGESKQTALKLKHMSGLDNTLSVRFKFMGEVKKDAALIIAFEPDVRSDNWPLIWIDFKPFDKQINYMGVVSSRLSVRQRINVSKNYENENLNSLSVNRNANTVSVYLNGQFVSKSSLEHNHPIRWTIILENAKMLLEAITLTLEY